MADHTRSVLPSTEAPAASPPAGGRLADALGSIGLRRLARATRYSFLGLRAAWSHETAFRQESSLALLLIPAALWLGEDAVERALLVGSCMLVLVVELLNSAIEAVVDRVGTDHHLLSARAKDLGSAAVFVSLALAVLVWALIAWQRFV
ncbi:MAG TPA: diacylglycerol kinase [Gammaproteobacteria bacterium]|nr:diacylglycerol kinase [Gammaproteobacteria bacterium]